MTHVIAGHEFNSLTPGERCTRVNCSGIQSLVELASQANSYVFKRGEPGFRECDDELKEGVDGIAHYGKLNSKEVEEIKELAKALKACMEASLHR